MHNSALVLASTSAFKQKQLAQLDVTFHVFNPEVVEDHNQPEAEALAIDLADQKAVAAARVFPDSLVIGSDQTAITEKGVFLTKPLTQDQAIEQLSACQNQKACFYSAICLIKKADNFIKKWAVTTEVKFRQLTQDEIVRYIKKDDPLHCAGSFKIEALGISLFDSVQSNDPSALIGLPLISLSRELRSAGLLIP
jgi:septum formation protein